MNFLDTVQSFFKRNSSKDTVYIALYVDVLQVAASFFSVNHDGVVQMLGTVFDNLKNDSWEEKTVVIDELLGTLEEKTGHTDVSKTILGLPSLYLTATGEIQKDVRMHIKKFTQELELTPVGFVPLQQSIIYKMRFDEGVPPSVILLGVNEKTLTVGVYKVGEIAGVREVEKHEDIVQCMEQSLRSFSDLEVLPARMLLYGSSVEELEDIKAKLLKHQWTSKVNFLHFPKIETLSDANIVESISLAGASELGAQIADVDHGEESNENFPVDEEVKRTDAPKESSDQIVESSVKTKEDEIEESSVEEETENGMHVAIADKTPSEIALEHLDKVTEEVVEAQEVLSEDFSIEESSNPDVANVVMVDAESLGFKQDIDILEEQHQIDAEKEIQQSAAAEEEIEGIDEEDDEDFEEIEEERGGIKLPAVVVNMLASISNIFSGFSSTDGNGKSIVVVGLGAIVIFSLVGLMYWLLPHATVTVLEVPKSFDTTQAIIIDPAATIVDAERGILPGRKKEKSVSSEKTIPVNGKKNVGDPSKGIITIYNKVVSGKTYKKGTVVKSGSLQFTLDEDVQVASASESIGSITFGKTDVRVTASAIGPQGNLPAASEFVFKDLDTSIATARNEKAFSGGTSREVTVVTRADYDTFVKSVSEELIVQAKQEFGSEQSGSEKIIDSTIKTTVTEKVFDQELDEEAKELKGKLTVTISGIAYSEADVRALLSSVSKNQIPNGYTVNDAKTSVDVTNIVLKKDGKITGSATMKALALPTLDIVTVQKNITGKSITKVQDYLKNLPGVGGVEFGFRYSPTSSYMPLNKNNISVTVSYLE